MNISTGLFGAAIGGSLLALVAPALAATAGQLISSADVRDDSLRSVDIRDGSVRARDIAPTALNSMSGSHGPDEVVRWKASFTADGQLAYVDDRYRFVDQTTYVVPKNTLVQILDFEVTGPLTSSCDYADLALQVLPSTSFSDDNVGKWSDSAAPDTSELIHYGQWYTDAAGPLAVVATCWDAEGRDLPLPSFEAEIVLALTEVAPSATRTVD